MVTGASGFVGRTLAETLFAEGHFTRVALRESVGCFPVGIEKISGCELTRHDNWGHALSGVDVVVHCAARVSNSRNNKDDALETFRKVNVRGTLNLARLSAQSGVRRFVFLSSVKVQGESTTLREKFSEQDSPSPEDAYGRSKLEAERELKALSNQTGMEVVIVRCPLVYGPQVKGNFQFLMKLADSPWPLPFDGIANARSLIYVGNLVDFLKRVSESPEAANQTFLVSDGDDVSTSDLLRNLRTALGRPARLFRFPWFLMRPLARLLGLKPVMGRLFGSLQVDISKARSVLGWRPPYSLTRGLAETVSAMPGVADTSEKVKDDSC